MIYKYERKLSEAGLTEQGAPLMGALDAELLWNRRNRHTPLLERLFKELNIQFSSVFRTQRALSHDYRSPLPHFGRNDLSGRL